MIGLLKTYLYGTDVFSAGAYFVTWALNCVKFVGGRIMFKVR